MTKSDFKTLKWQKGAKENTKTTNGKFENFDFGSKQDIVKWYNDAIIVIYSVYDALDTK